MQKPYKIALIGAECTGKTTTAKAIAARFGGVFVPEPMRLYLHKKPKGYICQYADLLGIMDLITYSYYRAISCYTIKRCANPLLVFDTAPILLKAYSLYYFNAYPKQLDTLIKHLTFDVLFLTDNKGIVWQGDGMRDLPFGHSAIYQLLMIELAKNKLDFYTLSGDIHTRLATVAKLLK